MKLTRKNQVKMRDEAREANSVRHRRRRKKNYTLYYLLVFILILITGVTLSITVFFNTERIVVVGNDNHSPEEILSYTEADLGDNLFRMNLTQMERNIMDQTVDLDDVKVSRKLPKTLMIEVTPAQASVAAYNGENYDIISSGGRIIHQTDDLTDYEGVFLLSGVDFSDVEVGEFIEDNSDYENMQKVLYEMEKRGLLEVNAMEVSTGREIKLSYQNKITIYLGSVLDLDYKLDLVDQLIEERISPGEEGVIDVRFSGEAIFRPMTMVTQQAKGIAVNQKAQPIPSEKEKSQTSQMSVLE
ncbi:MAG: cell division protein FtsQ/DivIB [Massiliimalia sp.]